MDVGGPTAMSMYSNAGGQGAIPDTGQAMGQGLVGAELAARTHYAPPSTPGAPSGNQPGQSIGGQPGVPYWYNANPGQPVKYSVPSEQKENLHVAEAVRKAAATDTNSRVIRFDPISEEEKNYVKTMKAQAELADFDRYVNSLIDPRKPGNLKWLMEIYPEYVNRRIQQVHTDYEFALRNQMIDSWGINTFDDLHFKFLVDQEKIKGPRLQTTKTVGDDYTPGWLSPMNFISGRPAGVRYPFASAKYGAKPANIADWTMEDNENQPLAANRSVDQLAYGLYNAPGTRTGVNAGANKYGVTSSPTGVQYNNP